MIKVIHYTDKAVEQTFEAIVEKSYDEVRTYLKNIPDTVNIYFDDQGIIPETGTGGFAYSHDTITLAVDGKFLDKSSQASDLRGTVFHESFHLAQHFTAEDGNFTALQAAIYEGCATVFERDYAQARPLFGGYQDHAEAELQDWLQRLQAVGDEYFKDETVWREWAFYNNELQQRWITYKTGTWLIDKILEKSGLTILDLQLKTADEIFELYTK